MAVRLRRELGIDVDAIRGNYGEYRVLVDDEVVVDGGPLVILGLMPSARKTVDAVRQRVSSNAPESDN